MTLLLIAGASLVLAVVAHRIEHRRRSRLIWREIIAHIDRKAAAQRVAP